MSRCVPRAASGQEPQIGGAHAAIPAPALGEGRARAIIAKRRNRTSRRLPRTALRNAKSGLGKKDLVKRTWQKGLGKKRTWQKSGLANEAHDVLGRLHGLGCDGAGAIGAIDQNGVDIA